MSDNWLLTKSFLLHVNIWNSVGEIWWHALRYINNCFLTKRFYIFTTDSDSKFKLRRNFPTEVFPFHTRHYQTTTLSKTKLDIKSLKKKRIKCKSSGNKTNSYGSRARFCKSSLSADIERNKHLGRLPHTYQSSRTCFREEGVCYISVLQCS